MGPFILPDDALKHGQGMAPHEVRHQADAASYKKAAISTKTTAWHTLPEILPLTLPPT